MNVKELKELLNDFPEEMDVVVSDESEDSLGDYMKTTILKIVTGIPLDHGLVINPDLVARGFISSRDAIKSYLYIGY